MPSRGRSPDTSFLNVSKEPLKAIYHNPAGASGMEKRYRFCYHQSVIVSLLPENPA